MEIIVTKYALSVGCRKTNGKPTSSGRYVTAKWHGTGSVHAKLGTEAAETEEEAIIIVRRMIEKKRASLTNQLARIDTLNPVQLVKDAKTIGGDA